MNTDPALDARIKRMPIMIAALLALAACSTGEASNSETSEAELLPATKTDSGSLLHASGFEPGWTLDIYPDRMVYVGRYGEERVVTPAPELLPRARGDAGDAERTYVAHTDSYEIRVHVLEQPCHDAGGRGPFEFTVVLDIGGQEYQGCGTRD